MTNSQITDSVRLAQLFTVESSPLQTLSMLNTVMAETLGMGMHNAISAQQNSQMVSAAASTSTCARLLAVQPRNAPPPPPPAPPAPPAPTQPFTLTVVGGTVTEGASTGSYTPGTPVPITAGPAPAGQVFQNWTGAVVANATLPSTVLAMPAANTTVTANFVAAPTFALTLTANPGGDGHCSGDGPYAAGATVSITATPVGSNTFTNWTCPDDVALANATAATTTITMPAKPITITANFS